MNVDALVVGAGPAGSSIAVRLARAGAGVALLERARFPRTKVCGEYLSPGALYALRDLGLGEIVAEHGHPIRHVSLAAFGAGPVVLALPGDGALALSRAILDDVLRDAALSAGAHGVTGAFLSAAHDGDFVNVIYRDVEGTERCISARIVVGADGAWSAVAQRAGLAGAQHHGGRWAVGGHLRGVESGNGDTLEMYVGAGGYYARNPLGEGSANAMLVMPRPVADDAAADAIVDEVTGGRLRFDGALLERRVAVGPLRYAPRHIATGRVMLAGDAAGLLDPFVGQGVAVALESSVTVAEAVLASLVRAPSAKTVRALSRARRALVLPRRILAAAVDLLIRTPAMRARALRSVQRDPLAAETVLAAVAGAAPAARALSPLALARLLA